jgi:D-psicose/D-tagatose/L-ribulose 3-epimerase
MRTVGIYYAFWTNEWDVDFLPFVKKVKALGYDQLEVNGGALVQWPRRRRLALAQEARENDLLLSYGVGITAEHDVSSPEASVRRNGIRFMRSMIECIHDMGGGTVGGSLYGSWPRQLREGEEKEAFVSRSLGSMREIAKIAEDNGVVLNLEVLNRFEQFMFNTCAEMLPFVQAIDSPNCGILLDTFHMNIEEDSLPGAIELAGPYLKELHVGETNRKPAGVGRQPWKEIKKALDAIRFDGPIVGEPFVMPGGQVGRDISLWRNLVENPDLDALAARSARFIRETLAG